MTLSIIVPCHNLEKYIHNLLNSFDRQENLNYDDLQFIFVLDDCTDNTEKIINKWLNNNTLNNSFIVKTNQHSAGLTRNIGKDHAMGEYIWFIDGDDWLCHTQSLYTVINILKSNPSIELLHIPYQCNLPQITAERSVWQYIFNTSLIKNIQFVHKEIGEDTDFLQRAIQQIKDKNNFKRIEGAPMYYYWHNRPGSITTNYILAHPEQFKHKGE